MYEISEEEEIVPSVRFKITGWNKTFCAVECSRFDGGTVSVGGINGLFMTVRAIFARHVSPLMHRRNRPVQARPGGL